MFYLPTILFTFSRSYADPMSLLQRASLFTRLFSNNSTTVRHSVNISIPQGSGSPPLPLDSDSPSLSQDSNNMFHRADVTNKQHDSFSALVSISLLYIVQKLICFYRPTTLLFRMWIVKRKWTLCRSEMSISRYRRLH